MAWDASDCDPFGRIEIMLSQPFNRGRSGRRWGEAATAVVTVAALVLTAQFSVASAAAARTVSVNGTLRLGSSVTLGSQLSGLVKTVSCEVNSSVKKGQVCAKIDPRPFQNTLDQARADFAQAKAQLEQDQASLVYARAAFERNSTLVQRGVVSKDAFENAQSNYHQAQAKVDVDKATIAQRQAAIQMATLNLEYTDVVSPIDGMVIARKVEVGETIAANFQAPALFVIASDPRKLKLVANIPEADIGGIKEGDAATFKVKAFPSRTFNARVSLVRLAPEGQAGDVTYGVTLDVDNPDLLLKPGMTAAIRITTADK
jgi:HlyD family secretion protein